MRKTVVTGGAGGIGSVVAKVFAKSDDVTILDIDDAQGEKLVELLGPEHCHYLHCDVTHPEEIADAVKRIGKISYLVSMAGRANSEEWRLFEEIPLGSLKDSIELNLFSHIAVVQAFYPVFDTNNDCAITLVSSINALRGYGLPGYSAAKAGLIGFMNAVVSEFGQHGVRINVLSPGTIPTVATEQEPKDFNKLLEGASLKHFAHREDIAEMAYAISHNVSAITGANIVVDAGQMKKV